MARCGRGDCGHKASYHSFGRCWFMLAADRRCDCGGWKPEPLGVDGYDGAILAGSM